MSMLFVNGTPVSDFESATITLRNQAASELRLTRPSDGDAPALIPYGGQVQLVDEGGRVHFDGKIATPRDGSESGAQHRQQLAAENAWRSFERKIYMVDYPFDDSPGTLDTRVLIGGKWSRVDITDPTAAVEGAYETVVDVVPIDVRDSLSQAIRFADPGLSLNIGLGGIIPPQQADGATVAQIIRTVGQFFPGAVGWIEPGTKTFNLKAASELEQIVFDASDLMPGWQVKERPELVLPGAALHLRKVIQSPGGAKETLEIFSAGNTAAEGAIIVPFDLQPEVHALEIAYLKIGELADVHVNSLGWWASYVPWVASAMASDDYRVTAVLNPQLQIQPGIFLPGDFNNVLLRGSVPESFLLYGCDGPYSRREPLVAVDRSKLVIPRLAPASATAKLQVQRRIPGTESWLVSNQSVSVPLAFTNLAGTGRYAWEDTAAFDPGEDPADYAALASRFFTESQRLGASGSITVIADQPAGEIMGRALSLTGLDPAWASMRAPIHTVEQDLHTGATRIEFGAADYLGLSTLADLMRALKHKRPPRRRSTRYGLPPEANLGASQGDASQSPPDPSSAATTPPPAAQPGRIKITILPEEAISNGATYTAVLQGGQSYGPFQSDEEAAVDAGRYTIHFSAASGYKPPPPIDGLIVNAGALREVDEELSTYTPADGLRGLEIRGWSNTQVRCALGTFNGQPIPGFAADDNASPWLISAPAGVIWMKIVANSSTGELTITRNAGPALPPPSGEENERIELIGTWSSTVNAKGRRTWSINQARFSPIEAEACRAYGISPSRYVLKMGQPI